jgi:hypothetical protein
MTNRRALLSVDEVALSEKVNVAALESVAVTEESRESHYVHLEAYGSIASIARGDGAEMSKEQLEADVAGALQIMKEARDEAVQIKGAAEALAGVRETQTEEEPRD